MNLVIKMLMLRNNFTEKERNLIREVEEFSPHVAHLLMLEIIKQKGINEQKTHSTPPKE